MRPLIRLSFIVCFSLCGFPCLGSSLHADELKARTLFQEHKYEEALDIYKRIASQRNSASVYFNTGLIESALQHPAEALYAFEQAFRLKPLNKIYGQAIASERKKITEAVVPVNTFFLLRWYAGLVTAFRPGIWALLGLLLLLWALFTWLNTLRLISIQKSPSMHLAKLIGCIGMLLICISFLSFHHIYREDEAIVMETTSLHQASTEESPELRKLGAGEKVKIEDQVGEWYYVALLNFDYGWIKKAACRKISVRAQ